MVLAGVQFLTLVLVGVLCGTHVSGSAALNPVLRSLDGGPYIELKQALDRAYLPIARPLMLSSLVATAALVVVSSLRSRPAIAVLAALALLGLLLTFAAILRGDLPINRLMASWRSAEPPSGWQEIRARWERFFAVRTVATTASLALLAGGALLRR